jgi:GNAT superfamily N-acetyltransferase
MSDPETSLIIRPASPDELDEIVAIDDDACALFQQAGLSITLDPQHPFTQAERACWARAARAGTAFLAGPPGGRALGVLVMDTIDGAPYLEQLSVRTTAMRRGLGRRLLTHAIEWAAGEALWLATYSHLPWNRPFYESAGFAVIPESRCPGWMVEILAEQRRWLPAPGERVAMRRDPRP